MVKKEDSNCTMVPRTHNILPYQMKVHILQQMEKEKIGVTEMSRLTNCPPSTIQTWKTRGVAFFQAQSGSRKVSRKVVLDAAVKQYIKDSSTNGAQLHRSHIAKWLCERHSMKKPAAESWVRRFLQRNDLSSFIQNNHNDDLASSSEAAKQDLLVASEVEKVIDLSRDSDSEDLSRNSDSKHVLFAQFKFPNIQNENGIVENGIRYSVATFRKWNIKCLDGAWLRDPIITFYSKKYLMNTRQGNFFIFDSQFYGEINIHKDGQLYEKTWKHASCFDWTGFQYIFFPICVDSHWSLMIIENPAATTPIYYHVNSLEGYHSTRMIAKSLDQFISFDLKRKSGSSNGRRRREIFCPTIPQQSNGDDCGVYMLYYMRKISQSLAVRRRGTLEKDISRLVCGCDYEVSTAFRKTLKKLLSSEKFFDRSHFILRNSEKPPLNDMYAVQELF